MGEAGLAGLRSGSQHSMCFVFVWLLREAAWLTRGSYVQGMQVRTIMTGLQQHTCQISQAVTTKRLTRRQTACLCALF
jgi:hypothetical protein